MYRLTVSLGADYDERFYSDFSRLARMAAHYPSFVTLSYELVKGA